MSEIQELLKNIDELLNKMPSNWHPVGTRVRIRVKQMPQQTKSGIFIPVNAADRETATNEIGVIVGIGPNAWEGYGNGEAWAKIGDVVRFIRHSGAIYQENDVDFRIINDVDLLEVAEFDEQN